MCYSAFGHPLYFVIVSSLSAQLDLKCNLLGFQTS